MPCCAACPECASVVQSSVVEGEAAACTAELVRGGCLCPAVQRALQQNAVLVFELERAKCLNFGLLTPCLQSPCCAVSGLFTNSIWEIQPLGVWNVLPPKSSASLLSISSHCLSFSVFLTEDFTECKRTYGWCVSNKKYFRSTSLCWLAFFYIVWLLRFKM